MDIAKTIGKNLTALMKPPAALDTCQKLAKGSGVSFGTIQRIKNGEVNITVEKLANGTHRITYRCTDNRAIQIDCVNAKGCQIAP